MKVRVYDSTVFKTISSLLSNAFWTHDDLRSFIASANVSANLISELPWKVSPKRDIVGELLTKLEVNIDEYKAELVPRPWLSDPKRMREFALWPGT
jgi:hypothetical protein